MRDKIILNKNRYEKGRREGRARSVSSEVIISCIFARDGI